MFYCLSCPKFGKCISVFKYIILIKIIQSCTCPRLGRLSVWFGIYFCFNSIESLYNGPVKSINTIHCYLDSICLVISRTICLFVPCERPLLTEFLNQSLSLLICVCTIYEFVSICLLLGPYWSQQHILCSRIQCAP
jgi:hypothetical protein